MDMFFHFHVSPYNLTTGTLLRNNFDYFTVRTTTDLEGIVAIIMLFSMLDPVRTAGLTTSGFSKVL